tara:strand:+ start:1418 stop:2374 length:957 start_codon:yes stop_codon:yes gene_type:complete
MKILVFIQTDNEKINSVSLESIQAAQKIAQKTDGTVSAMTFNKNTANKLCEYNLNEVILINDDLLTDYRPLHYVKTLETYCLDEYPDIIIFGHTYEARDWVPRLSARLDMPFISDCIGFNYNNSLSFTRSVYQGKLNADLSVKTNSFIVSFQSGAFKTDALESGSANVRNFDVEISNISSIIEPGEKFQESESSVDLSQAELIVSVGRGIGKEENLPIVRELASALKAELASSRPVVDSGWLESYHQVGSSGQNVSPKLYFAIGISGAIQHMVGMKGSKNIVVINKDPNAPIFEIADYGIVGDIFEIVPKLTELIQSS